ncbi:N-acetylmuramoyl-L-alanine amidase [Hymenobacter sediminis]|uniref:N-acetylmuramoyl-L-alanine amidase n=1 Tax=Hymenobacter sediminis TaxID=2218621 RepID=UPI000DA6502D|nr:N-acetylmuramoyl-L-alanine amidase [Hymenobacter sediminis]RPD46790.1 N-acetylmuramoyl-L-alanine amidase [Hymenobacter sediminis]
MRQITHLVVHCTATPQTATVAGILNYWKTELGWKNPGYHILISPDGRSTRLLADELVSNGVAGHNARSLHVSYIGGVDSQGHAKDTRTAAQKAELLRILTRWRQAHPGAIIQGHRNFPGVTKACPSFDARAEYARL